MKKQKGSGLVVFIAAVWFISFIVVLIVSTNREESPKAKSEQSQTMTVPNSPVADKSVLPPIELPGVKHIKKCVEGTIWVIGNGGDYWGWGAQQLDMNGKPIPCVEKK
ncbi:MAG: hypothetical protein Q7S34_01815 [bacterium]|nr:hypothetical protein [bacterium]